MPCNRTVTHPQVAGNRNRTRSLGQGVFVVSRSTQKKNRRTLLKFIIFVACVLIAQNLLRIPRIRWSAKDSPGTAVIADNVRGAVARAKDIERVIIISLDTVRADHLGCYGYSRNTSVNIDTLAAQSLLFNHALSPMPMTLPAHSSMMTGTDPHYHQVHDNIYSRLGDSNITLAEILKEQGFVTGAIIGAFALDARFGLDQGFDTYDDDIGTEEQTSEFLPFSNERNAEEVTKLAEGWLAEHRTDKFFLFVHYYDPHFPYVWHNDTPFKFPFLFQSYKDAYDSEIAYTDRAVGRFIDRLKQMGLYDSTLIILVGDHGEALGDHKESGHGFFVYHSTIHVPLIVKLPGLSTAVRINDVVSLIDIVPTVCQLLGIEPPTEVEGKSLLADVRQDRHRAVYCESLTPTVYKAQSLLGLVTERYKYIYTTRPELYDLFDDPGETENVIDGHPEIATTFEDRLLTTLSGTENRPSDRKIEFDPEARARLAALGYVGGAVDDDYDLTGTKEDPKDIIEFYERWQRIYLWIADKDYAKAKDLVLGVIAERPDFCDTVMSAVAYALATNPDPTVRDPEAAITIAQHGAEVTQYSDVYNLRALTAAYDAAGRREEAEKAAVTLLKLDAEMRRAAKGPPIPGDASGGNTPNTDK